MSVYQVSTDASYQFQQSAAAPALAFTPTAVQGNLSHLLSLGALLVTQGRVVEPATFVGQTSAPER